ncbi:MAG: acyltransferase [Eubacteriales bacterium]|nr:acyltransferase [Eubacteriales bacterium]
MEKKNLLSSVNKYRSQIMGLAAIWILIYHEWQIVASEWSRPYYVELFIKSNGFIGVDIFLLLSGMGLTYAVGKYSLSRFYIRRYRKLIVPVLAAAILNIFISRWSISYFFKCLCAYTFLTEDVTVFLWYVYAIAIFYLFFPLYYRFFDKCRNKYLFFACTIAVWFGCARLLVGHIRYTDWLIVNRVPVFLLGCLFGYMEQSGIKPERKIIIPISLVFLIIGGALEYYCGALCRPFIMPMPTVFLPALLVGVSLTFLTAALFEKLGRSGHVLKFYGQISLEIYCLQEVMGKFLIPILSERMPPIAVNLVFIVFVTFCAYLLHRVSECITKKSASFDQCH